MAKTTEEMAAEFKQTLANLKTELDTVKSKETASPSEVQAAHDAIENFKTANEEVLKDFAKVSDIATIKQELKDAQDEIEALIQKGNTVPNGEVSFDQSVSNTLTEKHEEIKDFVANKSKGGWLDIQVKVPELITSGNITTAVTPDNYAGSQATTYDPFLRDEIFIEQYFDVGSTDMPSLPYVNEEAGEGDAEIVAEGGLKPLIDADFNVKYSTAKKVAGRMKASEESLSDFKWLQAAMTTTLKRKHDIARQNDLLGVNGIAGLATPFNSALLTGLATLIQNPQKYDAIVALQTAITVQSEGVFKPNVIFVNNIDSLDMKLEKDDDNNYLTAPFVSADGTVIDGIRVVAKPTIPVGDFIIGDFKNVNLRNVWEYMIRFGYENDDFSKNLITMIGESRYHLYITDNEKRAIISGTFDDVIAAL
jgi:hypothetical protein